MIFKNINIFVLRKGCLINYSIFLIIFNINICYGQCDGNIIVNGSFNSVEGEAITAPNWTPYLSPDINDAIGSLNTTPGYNWTGTPLPSRDNGTWQNLFALESVEQNINLNKGQKYFIRFEYASQGISNFNDPVGINIYINDTLFYSSPEDSSEYSWEYDCISYYANYSGAHSFKIEPSQWQYLAVDGICITSKPIIDVNLGSDTTICPEESIILNATFPNTQYLWNNGSTNPVLVANSPGVYWVNVYQGECVFSDTIIIDKEKCDAILELPNVFTPNYDGVNDMFTPIYSERIKSMNTTIYNRWGSQVFQSNHLLIQWDAADVNSGTYYWLINYIELNGRKNTKHGIVTVFK